MAHTSDKPGKYIRVNMVWHVNKRNPCSKLILYVLKKIWVNFYRFLHNNSSKKIKIYITWIYVLMIFFIYLDSQLNVEFLYFDYIIRKEYLKKVESLMKFWNILQIQNFLLEATWMNDSFFQLLNTNCLKGNYGTKF